MKMITCEPGFKQMYPNVWRSPFSQIGEFREYFPGKNVFQTMPAVNIKETEAGFEIEFASPGFKKEDFKISAEKNTLKITAKREAGSESKDDKFTRREFNYASFEQNFRIPEVVDTGNIQGKYENGILKISLPKRAEAKEKVAREISVS